MKHQGEIILNSVKNQPQNLNKWIVGTFIVWPFLGFLLACKNFQNSFNRRVILIFFMLYGLTFFVNPVMDAKGRADSLKVAYNEPFNKAFNSIKFLYKETLDFVEPIILFSVSRVTQFHGVLFSVYALIFGSLMLFYLNEMYHHFLSNRNINSFIFFVLLIFVNPINEINGFRMWTAAWMFSVGVLKYLINKNLSNILFIAFSIFIHFSFMPLVFFFMLYVILGNRSFLYGIFAIITFFISELDIEQVRTYAALLGTASEEKVTSYTHEVYMETVAVLRSRSAWFVILSNNGIKYFTIFSLIFIFLKTKGRFVNPLTESFYSISLLLLSFANLSSLLPSGGRFFTVFYIFGFSTLLLFYVYEYSKRKLLTINMMGLPIILLFLALAFRLFSDTASLYLFGPSFTMFIAFTDNISLQSVLF